MLRGDINTRVGNNEVTNIVGTSGEATLNYNGKKRLDFCAYNNLKILNTFFKNKYIHKFSMEARGHKSGIELLKRQKKPGETIKKTSRSVRREWVNKWPNSMLAR